MSGESFGVLVADDHPVYREGLIGLIRATDDLTVVGEAPDGVEAVRLAAELSPDVVVMDIDMPGLNGVEATRRIVAAAPGASVLILSMLDDETVFEAMSAGARGYLVKSSSADATLAAIRSVAQGDIIFSAGLASRLTRAFTTGTASSPALRGLTPREHEVLDLIARGWDNPRIADRLAIAGKTVRNVVSNILVKLQVADRAAAIAKARQAGLG